MKLFLLLAQVDLNPLPKVGTHGDNSGIETALAFFWTLIAAVCVLVITISGFRFVLSRGEPQAIATAKNAIIYAAIGLVVSVSATMIVRFVFRNI